MRKMVRYSDENGEVMYEQEGQVLFERFKDKEGYLMIANNLKVMHLVKPGFPECVKDSDIGCLLNLCSHLDKDGVVMGKKAPMKLVEMTELLGIHRSSLTRMLDRLEVAGAARLKNGMLFVNPIYFTKNRYVSPMLYQVFEDELELHIPEWAQKRYQLLGGTPC